MGRAPGGVDHVSALLHARTPPSKQDQKAAYAAELRAQMAAQQAHKRRADDEYHSRSPRRDALSDTNAAPRPPGHVHGDVSAQSRWQTEQAGQAAYSASDHALQPRQAPGEYGDAFAAENDPYRAQAHGQSGEHGYAPAHCADVHAGPHYRQALHPSYTAADSYQRPQTWHPQAARAALQPSHQQQHYQSHASPYDHSPAISPDPQPPQWRSYQQPSAPHGPAMAQQHPPPRRSVAFDSPVQQPSQMQYQHSHYNPQQWQDIQDYWGHTQPAQHTQAQHQHQGDDLLERYGTYKARRNTGAGNAGAGAPEATQQRGRGRQREPTRPEETVGVLAYLSGKPDAGEQERKKQAYRCGLKRACWPWIAVSSFAWVRAHSWRLHTSVWCINVLRSRHCARGRPAAQ